MQEFKTADTNTKTQLSLAAALFFSPLVQNMLTKNTRDISDQDREFIHGYIKYGYITILFWLITIVTGVMNYLLAWNVLNVIATVSIFILIFLLLISVVSILSDIRILGWSTNTDTRETLDGDKKGIIFKYLPLYNIYLWYKLHSFEKPNWRIKESLFLRILFALVGMTWSVIASTIVLIAIILRVAALMSDIDFFSITIKQRINPLFLKNPEEMRWYLTGSFFYLVKLFTSIFTKIAPHLQEEILKEKEAYSHIIWIKEEKKILIEYFIWILLMVWIVYFTGLDLTIWTYDVWLWLFIFRYLLMWIQLKHLPHLPIAREIMIFFQVFKIKRLKD